MESGSNLAGSEGFLATYPSKTFYVTLLAGSDQEILQLPFWITSEKESGRSKQDLARLDSMVNPVMSMDWETVKAAASDISELDAQATILIHRS